MKKLLSLILAVVMIVGIMPSVIVSAYRGTPFLWIEAEDSFVANEGYTKKATSNASGGNVLLLYSTLNDKEFEASIPFTITNDNNYDIYVLGTPGDVTWCSKFTWCLDDGEYTYAAEKSPQVYIANDGVGGGMFWLKLSTADLKRGKHNLSFLVTEQREMTARIYYQAIDSIAIVPSSWGWNPNGLSTPYDPSTVDVKCVGGEVTTAVLQPEGSISVDAEFVSNSDMLGEDLDLCVDLVHKGSTIAYAQKAAKIPLSEWTTGSKYKESFEIQIPFDAPMGTYEIRGRAVCDTPQTSEGVITTVVVGKEPEPVVPVKGVAESFSAKAEGGRLTGEATVSVSGEVDFDLAPYVTLWKDDLLWGVVEGDKSARATAEGETVSVTFSGEIPENIPGGEYTAKVGLHNMAIEGSECKVNVASETDGYYKPLSYGNYYAEKTGKNHFWYVNQAHALIWDGAPYVPFGGMFCPRYLIFYNPNDPATNKANFEIDKADLLELKKQGVLDLYLNIGSNYVPIKPAHAVNYLLNFLEEEGFYYGIMPSVNQTRRAAKAYLPRTNNDHNNAFRVDVTTSGEATYKYQYASTTGTPVSLLYTVVDNATQSPVQVGEGVLRNNGDNTFTFIADVKVEKEGDYSVYFTPETYSELHTVVNYWTYLDEIREAQKAMAEYLECGDNFRAMFDIVMNETGIYNHSENARFTGEEYNIVYERELKEQYSTIADLNTAWKVTPEIESFEVASRIYPIYTTEVGEDNNYYTYYYDLETKNVYKANTRSGRSWEDFIVCRDRAYYDFYMESADIFKAGADLPVVSKHVSVQTDYYINKELKGGFDGVGSETYGNLNLVGDKMLTSSTHADQSARTMWTVVTETNTLENMQAKFDSGEYAYPSEEYFTDHFNTLFANGSKGMYDFLLAAQQTAYIHTTYSWLSNPQMFEWFQNYQKKYLTDADIQEMVSEKYKEKVFYLYPAVLNWWTKPNQRTVVQHMDDTNNIKRLVTNDGISVAATKDLNIKADVIFVNIVNGPYSNIYGEGLTEFLNGKNDKRIVVLGHRNDLGTIPVIDKYFTDEKVEIEGVGTVQVLNPTETSEVLYATEDGKPWALRDGELWIIANDQFLDINGEWMTLKYVAELGITDTSTIERENKTMTFSDITNHWAKKDIERMAKEGLVLGVGDGKFAPEEQMKARDFITLMKRITGAEDVTFAEIKDMDAPITREEAAYVINTIANLPEATEEHTFGDSDKISDWAKESVNRAFEMGIFKGYPNGSFAPDALMTRAEATVLAGRVGRL